MASPSHSPSQAPILVIGATRGTGQLVVEELLARGQSVRVAARDVGKARALFAERVQVVQADLLHDLPAGLFGDTGAVVFTAAVPPRPAGEALVRATEVEGLRRVLERVRTEGFTGRFVYLTTMGVTKPNWMMALLGLLKRGILQARRDAEALLATSGLDVTIVRAATLTNAAAGQGLTLVAGDEAMAPSKKVARADVARVLVESLRTSAREVSVWAARKGTSSSSIPQQLLAAAERGVQAAHD
jgi:uncharacterized protein YbjT (DUF2867 family)